MSGHRRITILDTTLRDGDQSPGFAFSTDEKIRIARLLESLGVDIIEAGFPSSSERQFRDVVEISQIVEHAALSAMTRAVPGDIERAGRALEHARTKVLHTSIATSPIHRDSKLRMTRLQVIDKGVEAVRYAKHFSPVVEIGAEDAVRTEPDFLADFCAAVSEAGADIINISDTVGYSQPDEFASLIRFLITHVALVARGQSRLSVHCHNDLGCATANTLAGIKAGASQMEVTLSGIGERSGNAPLEETVLALIERKDFFNGITTGVNPEKISDAVREVARMTGIPVSPMKAVTGRNNSIHASGIHQHGLSLNAKTYSLHDATLSGLHKNHFAISRHSGRAGITQRIDEIAGYHLEETEYPALVEAIKARADEMRTVDATTIIKVLSSAGIVTPVIWTLENMSVEDDGSGQQAVILLTLADSAGNTRVVRSVNQLIQSVHAALNDSFGRNIILSEYSYTESGNNEEHGERFFLHGLFSGREFVAERYGGSMIEQFVRCYLDIINQILVSECLS